jgi:hypothetical protein
MRPGEETMASNLVSMVMYEDVHEFTSLANYHAILPCPGSCLVCGSTYYSRTDDIPVTVYNNSFFTFEDDLSISVGDLRREQELRLCEAASWVARGGGPAGCGVSDEVGG